MNIGTRVEYRHSGLVLTNRQIFEEFINTKFNGNPYRGCQVADGRTDRQQEAKSRFSNFSTAPKKGCRVYKNRRTNNDKNNTQHNIKIPRVSAPEHSAEFQQDCA
jgi:hypothetical protein